MYGLIKDGYIEERLLNEEARLMIRSLDALYEIEETCALQTACYRCPFCRYQHDRIIKERIYEVRELCALYDIFGKIPRTIETGKLRDLFEEGRIADDEVLYNEEAEGSERTGQPEAPSAPAADRSERDAEDPESDN